MYLLLSYSNLSNFGIYIAFCQEKFRREAIDFTVFKTDVERIFCEVKIGMDVKTGSHLEQC